MKKNIPYLFFFCSVAFYAMSAAIYLAKPYCSTFGLLFHMTLSHFKCAAVYFLSQRACSFSYRPLWGLLHFRAQSLSVYLILGYSGCFTILLIFWVEQSLCDSSSTLHCLKAAECLSICVMWTLLILFTHTLERFHFLINV